MKRHFTHRDMQDFTMDYDLPSGDSDVRRLFGMQILDDEGAKSDQFSMSDTEKPTNIIAPIVSRIQLFEDTMWNTSSSHVLQGTDEQKIESVAMFFVGGLRQAALTIGDVSQRIYFTPIDHENASAAYSHYDSGMIFKFTHVIANSN